MFKNIIIIICAVFLTILPKYPAYTSIYLNENNSSNNSAFLKKGTFLRAVTQREISTATSKIGDEVKLLATMSTFAKDFVIIPEGSVYIGQIKELYSPVEGLNAAIKIEITKIIFPSGDEKHINAHLSTGKGDLIGGDAAPPAYYMKVPQFTEGWKGGCLSFQHSGIYQMGVPTVIRPGAELFVILNEDLNIGNNYY